jgi:hypothetical protein
MTKQETIDAMRFQRDQLMQSLQRNQLEPQYQRFAMELRDRLLVQIVALLDSPQK